LLVRYDQVAVQVAGDHQVVGDSGQSDEEDRNREKQRKGRSSYFPLGSAYFSRFYTSYFMTKFYVIKNN
ncbi:MAG: hypothetical protein QM433_04960, partial [Euryarchaeota archaeon]|nr:hypothetical protein [Euryarchaeota archaeon]